jgi:PAS domain-containing protein
MTTFLYIRSIHLQLTAWENLESGAVRARGLLVSKVVASLNSARQQAELCKQEALYHQETLRQSEERFRLLVEDVKDYAIFMLDPNGNVASGTKVEKAFLATKKQRLLASFSPAFLHPKMSEAVQPEQEMRTAEAVGRADDERWHFCKDGTTFWASGVLTHYEIRQETCAVSRK